MLTPPSRRDSIGSMGVKARLPPVRDKSSLHKSSCKSVDSNENESKSELKRDSKWQWRKLSVDDHGGYMWLPTSQPHTTSTWNCGPDLVNLSRPVSATSEAEWVRKPSVSSISSFPVAEPAEPIVSRRWSSTAFDQTTVLDVSILQFGHGGKHYHAPRRVTLPRQTPSKAAYSAIKSKLSCSRHHSPPRTVQMDTPSVITLRRASAVLGTYKRSAVTSIPENQVPRAGKKSSKPKMKTGGTAYMIHESEVDNLANLIQRTFSLTRQRHEKRSSDSEVPCDDFCTSRQPHKKAVGKRYRALSFDHGKLEPRLTAPANTAYTITEVHVRSLSPTPPGTNSTASRLSPPDWSRRESVLSHISGSRRSSIVSSMQSKQSVHEIIWEEDGRPQHLRSSTWKCGGPGKIPEQRSVATWSNSVPRVDELIPFDPSAELSSYNSGTSTPKPLQQRPTFRSVWSERSGNSNNQSRRISGTWPGALSLADRQETPIDDVISFPPLPKRNSTSDWQVPLPDDSLTTSGESSTVKIPVISLHKPSTEEGDNSDDDEGEREDEQEQRRNLYKLGIDASFGSISAPSPSVKRIAHTAPTTPAAGLRHTFWGGGDASPSRSPREGGGGSPNPLFGYGAQDQRRRSSAVLGADVGVIPRGNPLHRAVSAGKGAKMVGAAIGVSSHARRKSSGRVLSILADDGGEGDKEEAVIKIVTPKIKKDRNKPWRKVRKDSAYPSLIKGPSQERSEDGSVSGSNSDVSEQDERQSLMAKWHERQDRKSGGGMTLQLPTGGKKKGTGLLSNFKSRDALEEGDEQEEERLKPAQVVATPKLEIGAFFDGKGQGDGMQEVSGKEVKIGKGKGKLIDVLEPIPSVNVEEEGGPETPDWFLGY